MHRAQIFEVLGRSLEIGEIQDFEGGSLHLITFPYDPCTLNRHLLLVPQYGSRMTRVSVLASNGSLAQAVTKLKRG
jgi:hypothetical protein